MFLPFMSESNMKRLFKEKFQCFLRFFFPSTVVYKGSVCALSFSPLLLGMEKRSILIKAASDPALVAVVLIL